MRPTFLLDERLPASTRLPFPTFALISQLKMHGLGVLITDRARETLDFVDCTYIIHDGTV